MPRWGERGRLRASVVGLAIELDLAMKANTTRAPTHRGKVQTPIARATMPLQPVWKEMPRIWAFPATRVNRPALRCKHGATPSPAGDKRAANILVMERT